MFPDTVSSTRIDSKYYLAKGQQLLVRIQNSEELKLTDGLVELRSIGGCGPSYNTPSCIGLL